MDSQTIIPFIKSVQNVFETMMQLPVQVGKPQFKQAKEPSYDVSGIIGMGGDVEGSIVLSFPIATAERVVSIFAGIDATVSHEDFPDAVGELVNMVSGGAKAQFVGKNVNISCPSVIIGRDHVVFGSKDVVCFTIPCSCDCGEFAVEVSIKQEAAQNAASSELKVAG